MKLILGVVLLIAVGASADSTAIDDAAALLKKVTDGLVDEVNKLIDEGKKEMGDDERKSYIDGIQPFLKGRIHQYNQEVETYQRIMENNIHGLDRTNKRMDDLMQQLDAGEVTVDRAVALAVRYLTVAKTFLHDFDSH